MSKGSEPAYPGTVEQRRYLSEDMFTVDKILCGGLTKRELFAAMAMQGLSNNFEPKFAASEAVRRADALLAALEGRA